MSTSRSQAKDIHSALSYYRRELRTPRTMQSLPHSGIAGGTSLHSSDSAAASLLASLRGVWLIIIVINVRGLTAFDSDHR